MVINTDFNVIITNVKISFVVSRDKRRMHRLGRSFDCQLDADFRIESVAWMAFRHANVVRLVVVIDKCDYKSALFFCLMSNFGAFSRGFCQSSNVPTSG